MVDVWNLMFYLEVGDKTKPTSEFSRDSIIYGPTISDLPNASAFVIERHIDDVVPRLGSLSSDVYYRVCPWIRDQRSHC